MRLRSFIIAAVSFLSGIAAYAIVDMARSTDLGTAGHWEVVEGYRAFVMDRANYQFDPQTGLHVTTPPPDPEPSLAALVAAGELVHVDLVLPNVPHSRTATRFWMKWARENPDVLHATGNPEYATFAPSGEIPLHLQLWFRKSATPAVQQLIRDLEQPPPEGN